MADIKNKIDDVLAKKDTPKKEASDKPSVWTPFAKKIYADIEIYFDKLKGSSPTRAVAEFYRKEIDDKLEDGKEKDGIIKYYNKKFKLPGITAQAYNYFAETVLDPKASEKDEKNLISGIEDILFAKLNQKEDIVSGEKIQTIAKEIISFIKKSSKKDSNGINERKG